jgi:hypothetical protein
MVKVTDNLFQTYESDYDKVNTVKSHFADKYDVPYSECVASRVGGKRGFITVIHDGEN